MRRGLGVARGVGRGAWWSVVWGPEVSKTRKQSESDYDEKDAGVGRPALGRQGALQA